MDNNYYKADGNNILILLYIHIIVLQCISSCKRSIITHTIPSNNTSSRKRRHSWVCHVRGFLKRSLMYINGFISGFKFSTYSLHHCDVMAINTLLTSFCVCFDSTTNNHKPYHLPPHVQRIHTFTGPPNACRFKETSLGVEWMQLNSQSRRAFVYHTHNILIGPLRQGSDIGVYNIIIIMCFASQLSSGKGIKIGSDLQVLNSVILQVTVTGA